MECPHLEESVKITAPPIKTENTPPRLQCSVCKIEKSPWICLHCGIINCGRYVNGHAKQHHREIHQHAVCMDCDSYAAYCYICDEFVINDTKLAHLDKVRKQLQVLASPQNHVRQKPRRRSSNEFSENRKRLKTDGHKNLLKPKSSGLRNLGNTCFMNAVLQSLSNIQQFCGYIKQLPSLDEKKVKSPKVNHVKKHVDGDNVFLVEELRKTLIALWQGTKGAISPESLFSVIWKVVPRFRGYQQQDAHEFMRYLLDRLHTELLSLLPHPNNNNSSPFIHIGPKGKSTIVTAIFGGILQNEVKCLVCGMESKKHDPFLDLSLDIPEQFATRNSKSKESPESPCQLVDCLSSFTDIEELEESELYMCNNCKKKQHSTKKFWIRRLPNVLSLHIKRFRWYSYFRVKLETYIEFPVKGLDMSKYLLNDLHETRGNWSACNVYDLAAVIVHHGSGAGSGHYTAYATNEVEQGLRICPHCEQRNKVVKGRWYHFNDSSVMACEEETVTRCKAYILFYVRREIKLPDSLNITHNGHGLEN